MVVIFSIKYIFVYFVYTTLLHYWDMFQQHCVICYLKLKERDSKLEEAGDLHRFLRDLDHFQVWLTKSQTDVASEDTPASLAEAEKLLSQHQTIREEIDNYTDDYTKMMEYGEKITAVSKIIRNELDLQC